VDINVEDDVDAPDSVDLDGHVVIELDCDDNEQEDQENADLEEVAEEDVNEEEDQDEDDGKEPRRNGQGDMVNTSADDFDAVVDDQPIMLPEQCQDMSEHTPRPQPPAAATLPDTLAPCPRPPCTETDPLSRLEHLELVTPQKPRPGVPTP
jgi:hypothetical protein